MRASRISAITMDPETHSKLAGRHRHIPPALLEKARQLRQESTSAEEILWSCLRNRQLNGMKFRRQHNLGQFIVDFYCHEARLVIEVDGLVHLLLPRSPVGYRSRWFSSSKNRPNTA
ncbi:MAG: endonuclease domain-containing protein [Cyanobacteria bacterium P01_C01_bin.89]